MFMNSLWTQKRLRFQPTELQLPLSSVDVGARAPCPLRTRASWARSRAATRLIPSSALGSKSPWTIETFETLKWKEELGGNGRKNSNRHPESIRILQRCAIAPRNTVIYGVCVWSPSCSNVLDTGLAQITRIKVERVSHSHDFRGTRWY
jgi:hypothetical protein